MVALNLTNEAYLVPPEDIALRIKHSTYPQVAEQDEGKLPRFHSVSNFCRESLNQLLHAADSPYKEEIIAANPDLAEEINKASKPHFRRSLEHRSAVGDFVHSTIPKLGTPEEPELWGQAERSIENYRKWQKIHNVQYTLAQEQRIFSKKLQFAGTPDFIGIVDGIPTIIDYKIGSKVHRVNQLQVQAYGMLVEQEIGFTAKRVCILLLPTGKDSAPSFIEYTLETSKAEMVHALTEAWHEYVEHPERLHADVPINLYKPISFKVKKNNRDTAQVV